MFARRISVSKTCPNIEILLRISCFPALSTLPLYRLRPFLIANETYTVRASSQESNIPESNSSGDLPIEKSTPTNGDVKSWVWFPSTHELSTHYFREIGFLASPAQFCGASKSSTTSVAGATHCADFTKPFSGSRASQLCRESTTKCRKVCWMGPFGPLKSLAGPVSSSRGMFLQLGQWVWRSDR